MTDKEILDWIEAELQKSLGGGVFWDIMHDVHKGGHLRELVARHLAPVPVDAEARLNSERERQIMSFMLYVKPLPPLWGVLRNVSVLVYGDGLVQLEYMANNGKVVDRLVERAWAARFIRAACLQLVSFQADAEARR